jgi:hypothetical protein
MSKSAQGSADTGSREPDSGHGSRGLSGWNCRTAFRCLVVLDFAAVIVVNYYLHVSAAGARVVYSRYLLDPGLPALTGLMVVRPVMWQVILSALVLCPVLLSLLLSRPNVKILCTTIPVFVLVMFLAVHGVAILLALGPVRKPGDAVRSLAPPGNPKAASQAASARPAKEQDGLGSGGNAVVSDESMIWAAGPGRPEPSSCGHPYSGPRILPTRATWGWLTAEGLSDGAQSARNPRQERVQAPAGETPRVTGRGWPILLAFGLLRHVSTPVSSGHVLTP